jgi:Kef-type K+ transport system membrane component KefB
VGLLVGPFTFGLLTRQMFAGRQVIDGVAVALIALTAGGEIRLAWLKEKLRPVATIMGFELLAVLLGMLGTFLALHWLVGVVHADAVPDGPAGLVIVAVLFATIAVANSPAVTIAVINETRADGPVARTVLAVTILKDLVVIVLFTLATSTTRAVLATSGSEPLHWTLMRELLGSFAVGLGCGAVMALYLERVGRELGAFVLVACFGMWLLADLLHLELLVVAVAAGFWVENFTKRDLGHTLVQGIELVALPVYAIFFAAAGTKVRLDVLGALWLPVLLLVAVRCGLIWVGTRTGARVAQAEPMVVRHAWAGFVSQAGVSLALAAIVARSFPGWGESLEILFIGMVAMHELIGPPVFLRALRKAGETERS